MAQYAPPLQIPLKPTQRSKIEDIARQDGISLAEASRRLLDAGLEQRAGTAPIRLTVVDTAMAYQKVFEALGAASMCWNPRPEGVFDPEAATKVGEDLLRYLGFPSLPSGQPEVPQE
jgi:hypothetical protein